MLISIQTRVVCAHVFQSVCGKRPLSLRCFHSMGGLKSSKCGDPPSGEVSDKIKEMREAKAKLPLAEAIWIRY